MEHHIYFCHPVENSQLYTDINQMIESLRIPIRKSQFSPSPEAIEATMTTTKYGEGYGDILLPINPPAFDIPLDSITTTATLTVNGNPEEVVYINCNEGEIDWNWYITAVQNTIDQGYILYSSDVPPIYDLNKIKYDLELRCDLSYLSYKLIEMQNAGFNLIKLKTLMYEKY